MQDETTLRERRAYLIGCLVGWQDGGYLVPTEPDPEARALTRIELRVAIDTLTSVLGDVPVDSAASTRGNHRDRIRIYEAGQMDPLPAAMPENAPPSESWERRPADMVRAQIEPGGWQVRWWRTGKIEPGFATARFEAYALQPSPGGWIPAQHHSITGRVRWDGCMDLHFWQARSGYKHFCGFAGLMELEALLGHIYLRAFEVMEREPDESDPHGLKVFRETHPHEDLTGIVLASERGKGQPS